jgi:hypothetical protein
MNYSCIHLPLSNRRAKKTTNRLDVSVPNMHVNWAHWRACAKKFAHLKRSGCIAPSITPEEIMVLIGKMMFGVRTSSNPTLSVGALTGIFAVFMSAA